MNPDSWAQCFGNAVRGRTVVVRVDHNVPLDKYGNIRDNTRIMTSARSLRAICQLAKRTVILSHLGYPKGRRENTLSTRPLFEALSLYLDAPALFSDDASPHVLRHMLEATPKGGVVYSENVRFLPGEELGATELARGWARLGEVFINDAFATSHRAHASVSGIAQWVDCLPGSTLLSEIAKVSEGMEHARRPGIIIGGAKSSTKIPLALELVKKYRCVCLGGLCGIDFRRACTGTIPIGLTVLDDVCVDIGGGRTAATDFSALSNDMPVCDTGPRTIARFGEVLADCDLLIWNGPLGAYERPGGLKATTLLCNFMEVKRSEGAHVIAGGGDTCAAINTIKAHSAIDSSLTAGGSMLAFVLHGWNLPGLSQLKVGRS